MEKINLAGNGQWVLAKSNQLFGQNETHEVEVHPHIDHLYRIKDHIARSGKPSMPISEIKKGGFPQNIVDSMPRDAKGGVTTQMLDDHIAGLPKHKVVVTTAPYTWGAQTHHPGAQESVVSIGLHPDTAASLEEIDRKALGKQHNLIEGATGNQIGWARIDTNKPNHWHVDEIQSDLNNTDKIAALTGTSPKHINREVQADESHPLRPLQRQMHEAVNNFNKLFTHLQNLESSGEERPESLNKELSDLREKASDAAKTYEKAVNEHGKKRYDPNKLLNTLSHGHEDPQHLIHSVVNALARKKGVSSLSMDTPYDQAEQSNLSSESTRDEGEFSDYFNSNLDKANDALWPKMQDLIKDPSQISNPNLKSALEKIGVDNFRKLIQSSPTSRGVPMHIYQSAAKNNMKDEIQKLSIPEIDALNDSAYNYQTDVDTYMNSDKSQAKNKIYKLPVHFTNTYDKRPKKLGFQNLPKKQILGVGDDNDEVQYSPVFKTIKDLKEKLNKVKRM